MRIGTEVGIITNGDDVGVITREGCGGITCGDSGSII